MQKFSFVNAILVVTLLVIPQNTKTNILYNLTADSRLKPLQIVATCMAVAGVVVFALPKKKGGSTLKGTLLTTLGVTGIVTGEQILDFVDNDLPPLLKKLAISLQSKP